MHTAHCLLLLRCFYSLLSQAIGAVLSSEKKPLSLTNQPTNQLTNQLTNLLLHIINSSQRGVKSFRLEPIHATSQYGRNDMNGEACEGLKGDPGDH